MSNNGTAKKLPIYPQLQWNDRDYATHKASLHLYDDHIVMQKFEDGESTEMYIVDPHDLAAALSGMAINTGPLPRNCLFWSRVGGQERIGIYVEPKVWPVSIEGERQTLHIPMPGLVFVGYGMKYHVWAVKEKWPEPTSILYAAPCPNTGRVNGVCRGTAPFPVAAKESMYKALDVFFSSGFNDHLGNQKSKKYPTSILKMWRKLNEAGADIYPEDDLVETKLTLEDVIGEVS